MSACQSFMQSNIEKGGLVGSPFFVGAAYTECFFLKGSRSLLACSLRSQSE